MANPEQVSCIPEPVRQVMIWFEGDHEYKKQLAPRSTKSLNCVAHKKAKVNDNASLDLEATWARDAKFSVCLSSFTIRVCIRFCTDIGRATIDCQLM